MTRHVRLSGATSARPGRFNVHWKPWTRYGHDAHFENPGKVGVVTIKPAQVGWSEIMVNLIGWRCVFDPGPIGYVTTDDEKATEFACDRFQPRVESTPDLRALFTDAAGGVKQRRDVMRSRPYRGGRVAFLSARAKNEFIGTPYKHMDGDEFEACTNAFDGDLFTAMETRRKTFKSLGSLNLFGHPKDEHQDIHGMWERESTMGRLVFDCPHCTCAVFPRWRHVKITVREDGTLDPVTARLHCPHCDGVISDGQRAAALVPREESAGGGVGGTSRFESMLSVEEQRSRRFVGVWFTRLCDPSVTVLELARAWAGKVSEEARREWMNKEMGEPYSAATTGLTVNIVQEAYGEVPRTAGRVPKLSGGAMGCRLFVVGTDVQRPKDNPFFYVCGRAFLGNGRSVITHLALVQGFAAWHQLIREMCVEVDGKLVGARCVGVDAGDNTQAVLEACRTSVYSIAGNLVDFVPMRYQTGAGCNADMPAVMAPARKRMHPTRPELPPLPYWYLWRHHWVERMVRSLTEKRTTIAIPANERPEKLEAHLMANRLVPVYGVHGRDVIREEYQRPDEDRDDWAQAMAFAEAAAACHLGLDQLWALAHREVVAATAISREEGPGFKGQVGGLTGRPVQGIQRRDIGWGGGLGGGRL